MDIKIFVYFFIFSLSNISIFQLGDISFDYSRISCVEEFIFEDFLDHGVFDIVDFQPTKTTHEFVPDDDNLHTLNTGIILLVLVVHLFHLGFFDIILRRKIKCAKHFLKMLIRPGYYAFLYRLMAF